MPDSLFPKHSWLENLSPSHEIQPQNLLTQLWLSHLAHHGSIFSHGGEQPTKTWHKIWVFSEYHTHLPRETIPQIVSHKIQQGLQDNVVRIFHIFPINLSVKVCHMTSPTAGTGMHLSGTGRMRLWALVHSTESCTVVFQRPPPGETENMRTGGGSRTKALCSWTEPGYQYGQGLSVSPSNQRILYAQLEGFWIPVLNQCARVCVCQNWHR